jgi:predicted dehydrogenase
MNNPIKTGVLSFGMSGSLFHCPFLELHAGFDLAAIVERSKKKAQDTYPNIKSYHTIDDLLKDSSIELVVVNTPSYTHFEFAFKALQHNKHILVEKPFTVTSAEAEMLFEEAKRRNLDVMPFQNRRYDSDYLSVKKIVESGKLGDLIEVHLRYDRYKYNIGDNVTKETPLPGNGLLYNLGPHLLDAAIDLFGMPLAYNKITERHRPDSQIDDYAHLHLQYPKGLQVFITASLLVADAQSAFVLHGTKGSYRKARADVQEAQLQSGIKPDNPLFGIENKDDYGVLTTFENELKKQEKIEALPASYSHIFEAVYKTIREKKPFPVTAEQVIKQIEILED